MPARRRLSRFPFAAFVVLGVAAGAGATPPPAARVGPPAPAPTVREQAEAAERRGDWDDAFSLYCRLQLAERTAETRDKITATLRRAQQARRHRDPAFRRFVETLTPSDALTLYAELVGRLPTLSADRDRATPHQLWANGVEEFDRALGESRYRDAFLDGATADKVAAFRASLRAVWSGRPVDNSRDARSQLRHLLAEAGDAFPVRVPAAVVVEFICGACAGLDEYTVFLSPTTPDPAAAALADLQAYGLYVSPRGESLVVDGVVPRSWAALQPTPPHRGDRLVRVNGRSVPTPVALADALRGPLMGTHEVEFADGSAVRLPVAVPTVYGDGFVPGTDGVGYVRIGAFRESTPRELDEVVYSLKMRGLRTLILDLRGNHGGLLGSGVEVAKRFVPAGIIVTTEGQVSEFAGRVFSSDSGMAAWDVPLVLLVDGETASAAEVVAGAFKDHNRATLVGLPTFGKGSVQFPVRLASLDDPADAGKPRSGSVRVTIARFVSPRGVPITGLGVTPDVYEADPQRQFELAAERAAEMVSPMARTPTPVP